MNAIVIDIDKQAFLFDNQDVIHILPDRIQQVIDINNFTDRRTNADNLNDKLQTLEDANNELCADLEESMRQLIEAKQERNTVQGDCAQWRQKVTELETLRDKHVYALERYESIIDALCKTINKM